jgi:hypothetical protein
VIGTTPKLDYRCFRFGLDSAESWTVREIENCLLNGSYQCRAEVGTH